ncbi:MAG: DUF4434 domain-containing protein [Acidobacteriia bacterium]|nr:DUF4434 domain-containing protein [Terriglobia bacterium]
MIPAKSEFTLRGSFLMFDRDLPRELWGKEFDYMREAGMDTVVVLAVGHLHSDSADPLRYSPSPDGLLFPSRWVSSAHVDDRLEMVLSLADERGIKVYIGSLQTESDWTTGLELAALRAYNKRIAAEIVERYHSHRSFVGWYFPQEIWMNWVKYYGSGYYGTDSLRDFVADMREIDSHKLTAATVVFKKEGNGLMPALASDELESVMTGFLQTTRVDLLMPQDGAGAAAGAAPIAELPSYFAAMAKARDKSGAGTALLAIIETFTSAPGLSNDRYSPAGISRIEQQLNAVGPYVSGSISWIFGHDMSPQATYYPAEAGMLYREYCARYGNAPTGQE